MASEKNPIVSFFEWLAPRFHLLDDLDKPGTIESVQKGAELRGSNLWTLIFAIFIASIGLNVNSTAVIIGAMLVSPLMGPIVGIGFAAATNDFDNLKKFLRTLSVATIASIATSFIYFSLSPINEAQSELLARTSPTIYDALIAIFGGATGIIANTRKEKGTAIAGVAIATALMPPLCTAGYGLSQGNWTYFLGATYLFLINSIFIAITTFIFVRYMEFPKVSWGLYKEKERKVKIYLALFTLILIIPSIFTAYQIVRSSYFKGKASEFIRNEILIDNRRILEKEITYQKNPKIELTIIGPKIDENKEKELQSKLKYYNIENTKLILHQDLSSSNIDNLKYEILSEIYKSNTNYTQINTEMIAKEIQIFFPNLISASFTKTKKFDMNQNIYVDTNIFDSEWTKLPTENDKKKLEQYIEIRTGEKQLELITREVLKN
ncbi:DUF389 domain-containing protein [Leptospira sp. 2 VSF19]|uniref:DUF389 domain-containing protein n=1 Tax=Leptospira soteropolitanensis TaxID=2950025 RepID=A0AAW5VN18_9LEPT|nr:DUF389 domain-containing protein [Leptospira soteropolitanensis]MCW7493441.1 DUF389 domain-containing protein [Leptospira soteropolitanensis]MCW7501027.1 DUF389 domain-containing protein [Leptospira soteropolitanensis]MCW7523293.1 DUF389 domain-containing protein [Leptospira soteropolitanensis]MCW7527154.1 DUF389 domain-containing protein [Leptospira soteropolitanensis]MCW7531011.1 DUF389 domain-containing protein [Leptospira soteropolitanensis]